MSEYWELLLWKIYDKQELLDFPKRVEFFVRYYELLYVQRDNNYLNRSLLRLNPIGKMKLAIFRMRMNGNECYER